MANVAHRYASIANVKRQLRISDTNDDDVIAMIIENISRQVDQFCNRTFWPLDTIKYFETDEYNELCIPDEDLLAVSEIAVDQNDDGVYEEVWSSGSGKFVLEPRNNASLVPAKPYWEIEIPTRNTNYFPVAGDDSIKITGTWGFYNETSLVTTVHTNIVPSDTTIALHNANTLLEVGQIIKIGSEQLQILSINGINVTVARACNGTVAGTYAATASVYAYSYPIIEEAVTHQAVLTYRQTQFPYGTVGVGDVNVEPRVMMAAGLHPFVRGMIAPFRRIPIAE